MPRRNQNADPRAAARRAGTDRPLFACGECRISFESSRQLIAYVKAVHGAAVERPRPAR